MHRWICAALLLTGCAHGARHTDAEGDTTVDVTCSTREDCEARAESLCGGPVQSIWVTRARAATGAGARAAASHDIAATARCQASGPGLSNRPQSPAEHGSWMAKSKVGGWCAADSTCESDLVCKHGDRPDDGVCARPVQPSPSRDR